jgi:hypothetical protein
MTPYVHLSSGYTVQSGVPPRGIYRIISKYTFRSSVTACVVPLDDRPYTIIHVIYWLIYLPVSNQCE